MSLPYFTILCLRRWHWTEPDKCFVVEIRDYQALISKSLNSEEFQNEYLELEISESEFLNSCWNERKGHVEFQNSDILTHSEVKTYIKKIGMEVELVRYIFKTITQTEVDIYNDR
ncbi:MAG: hypothetical protein O2784_06750 [Proteobacteria bacterium]|nr:hypothetical protein [Pseudomonadota bacterium]